MTLEGFSMTVVSRAWSRLTLPGKIVFTVVPLLLALGLVTLFAIILLGPLAIQFVNDNLPLVRFVVAATAVLLISIPIAFMNSASGPTGR